jgi:hypothetical protein
MVAADAWFEFGRCAGMGHQPGPLPGSAQLLVTVEQAGDQLPRKRSVRCGHADAPREAHPLHRGKNCAVVAGKRVRQLSSPAQARAVKDAVVGLALKQSRPLALAGTRGYRRATLSDRVK